MIVGIFHKGSGIGNQLFRYIAVRVIALDKGYVFSIINKEGFEGSSFMKLDMGKPNNVEFHIEKPSGKVIPHTDLPLWEEKKVTKNGTDVRGYDPEFNFIKDNTIIDGEFQGEKYFVHRKNEIREWLKINPINLPENLCIINFRGREYVSGKELFLSKKYWDNAILNMQRKDPNMQFRIVTDDVKTARKFFPKYEISHDLANDYTSIQYARYLVLSNSSFAILPAWLNQNVKLVIAPKYWARHNVSDGYWSCEYNIVDGWMYQDRNGNLQNYIECMADLKAYKDNSWYDTTPITMDPMSLKERIVKILPKNFKRVIKKIINR